MDATASRIATPSPSASAAVLAPVTARRTLDGTGVASRATPSTLAPPHAPPALPVVRAAMLRTSAMLLPPASKQQVESSR